MSRDHTASPDGGDQKPKPDSSVVGGLYLDEAGEHPPDYGEPLDYDEHRWGGPHRDETRGGMPTMSVSRVLALQVLAKNERTTDEIIDAIASGLLLDEEAIKQRTQTGDNRLEIRVHWALATLRRSGYIEVVENDAAKTAGAPKSTEFLETYAITAKGKAMLEQHPVRIDESGTGTRHV